jgi:thiosulfate dehydrogenase
MRHFSPFIIAAALCCAIVACRVQDSSDAADSATIRQSGGETWNAALWLPPTQADLTNDSLSASIRRGLAILKNTRDSLPGYVGGNLSCTSCHLDEGRRANAAPLTGVMARFPKYLDRSGAVITLEDRVNYCFTRSLAGNKVPSDSREMQDIIAYLAWISRGVPIGAQTAGQGMPKMPALEGDSSRGHALYTQTCARCHGVDGAGVALVPALWGPQSFSIGASMARRERAASFIRHNMPFDQPGTLSDQQAFDVSAYITSLPRPDSPGKADDWPFGGAPVDAPYDTKGHRAYKPPRTLVPRSGAGAIVPAPSRAAGRVKPEGPGLRAQGPGKD